MTRTTTDGAALAEKHDTNIEWTHPPGYTGSSWNWIRGCSRTIAEGATRSECGDATGGGCYAERDGGSRGRCASGKPYDGIVRLTGKGPRWTGQVRLIEHRLLEPLRKRAPHCYFVASVSDPFHENVSDAWRDQAFAVMALSSRLRHHLFILLTKHGADNGSMRRYLNDPATPLRIAAAAEKLAAENTRTIPAEIADVCAARLRRGELWPIPRLALGISAGLQASLDARWAELRQVPAWLHVLSLEPLLERLDLTQALRRCGAGRDGDCAKAHCPQLRDGEPARSGRHCPIDDWDERDPGTAPTRAGWVLLGGESKAGARPCALEWIEDGVEQCAAARVPVFVKQLGARVVSTARTAPAAMFDQTKLKTADFAPSGEVWAWKAGLRGKAGDPATWPAKLRVRQYPAAFALPEKAAK